MSVAKVPATTVPSMGPVARGNTTPALRVTGRAFQWTFQESQFGLFGFYTDWLKTLKSVSYVIACQEVAPTTGQKHIHMYVHFTKSYTLPAKVLATHVHVERCIGSPKQNIAYIRKDGNIIFEYGEEPAQGKIATVKELLEADPMGLPPHMIGHWMKCRSMFTHQSINNLHKDVTVYYIDGPSGSGKTLWWKNYLLEHKIKEFDMIGYRNTFWMGVTSTCNVAVYDEFRHTDLPASEFIKLIDYTPQIMNVKGMQLINNYTLIFITSIIPFDSIYPNVVGQHQESSVQWKRRIKHITITPENKPSELTFEQWVKENDRGTTNMFNEDKPLTVAVPDVRDTVKTNYDANPLIEEEEDYEEEYLEEEDDDYDYCA